MNSARTKVVSFVSEESGRQTPIPFDTVYNFYLSHLETLGSINRDSHHGARCVARVGHVNPVLASVDWLTGRNAGIIVQRHEVFTDGGWYVSWETITSQKRVCSQHC